MKITVREMTLISLFTVLIIIGSKISFPILMIPVTLQLAISLLTGCVLGARLALIAHGLYLLIGLIGLPVFAAGGGLAYLLQPSFGYLPGMLLAAGLTGWLSDLADPRRERLTFWRLVPINLAGLLVVYLCGVGYLYLIKNFYAGQSITWLQAIKAGMLPFLLIDSLKALLAAVAGPLLRRLASPSLQRRQGPAGAGQDPAGPL